MRRAEGRQRHARRQEGLRGAQPASCPGKPYPGRLTSPSSAGRCYLAELFVDPQARRQGIATAMIEWVAKDGDEHGSPRLYWNTEVDADARALYDKIAVYRDYVVYNYSRPAATAVM
ncbi:GNAT family N-acetyltransferase [Micromonospora sp. NPDC005172]|uniref:GNAT family N-acetyltransferase n=1 Tax=Micromonospora sp. NPDC005172 TaxID=3156867 RepID=UPI0033A60326